MFAKFSSIDTAQIVTGALGVVVGAVLMAGLGRAPVESAPAAAPSQVARYQPAEGAPSVQTRQARNQAMATVESPLVDHCPRCR